MDDKVKRFCENYEMTVVNDTGRYARYRRPTFFSDPYRADIIQNEINEFHTEKLYTVQIPESRLNTLAEMEGRFFNNRTDWGTRDMFEILMDKEREESYYRQTNEAVKKAYENYSMMLHLAGYEKKL